MSRTPSGRNGAGVLEGGGGYGPGGYEMIGIIRTLDDGLWESLLKLAREVDRLKG